MTIKQPTTITLSVTQTMRQWSKLMAPIPGWYSRAVTLPIAHADGTPIGSVQELKKG